MATLAAKLLALYELHKRGLLTDDEFARAKAREIAAARQVAVRRSGPPAPGQPAPRPAPFMPPKTLNPVVPAVVISLGAAGAAGAGGGGLGG